MKQLSKIRNIFLSALLVLMASSSTIINVNAEDKAGERQTSLKYTEEEERNNALFSAKSFIQVSNHYEMGTSKEDVIRFLHQEKFSQEVIDFVMAEINVDWKEQALIETKWKLELIYSRIAISQDLSDQGFSDEEVNYAMTSISKDQWNQLASKATKELLANGRWKIEIKDKLMIDYGFTQEEAEFGIKSINWVQEAMTIIQEFIDLNESISKSHVVKALTEDFGFSQEEIEEAFDTLQVDWNQQAINKAQSQLKYRTSKRLLILNMSDPYGFSQEEIDYALEKLDIDWNEQAVMVGEMLLEQGLPKEDLVEFLMHYRFTEEEAEYGAAKVLETVELEDTGAAEESDDKKDSVDADNKEEANATPSLKPETSKPEINEKDTLPSTGMPASGNILSILSTLAGAALLAYNKKES